MADISYVKGRLEGLFDMVSLLRELLTEDVANNYDVLQKMVDRVYVELGEILDVVGSNVPSAVEKAESILASKMGKAKGVHTKDVITELISKKGDGE